MWFWKWEVWPWNWRKVRKTQDPLPDENSLHPPDEELQQRAELLAKRATQLLAEITPESAGVAAGVTYKAIASTQDFMQSQSCYAELSRRQDIRRADRERSEALERSERDRTRETRHFWIELIVIGLLIVGEIGLSIYYGQRGLREGKEQGAILEQMNKNTKDTAAQIQRAADAMTAFLKIAQQQEADRLAQIAKKFKLVVYVGRIPLTQVSGPWTPTEETDTSVTFHIVLRNKGDATANRVTWRVLVPRDVTITSYPLPSLENYLPDSTSSSSPIPDNNILDRPMRAFSFFQGFISPKGYTDASITFIFLKGYQPFKAVFNFSSPETEGYIPLGVLTVTPRRPPS